MTYFLKCVNKDRMEFIRGKKNILCLTALLGLGGMVLLTTVLLPDLLERVGTAGNFLNSDTSLSGFMEKFFPSDLKKSIGMFSSDVGVFYSLLIIILSHSLLPDEISSGKIILPLCAGYNRKVFLFSKELVYSGMVSVPVFASYMLYFYVGSRYLENDFAFNSALWNALSLTAAEFFICAFTVVLSGIFRRKLSVLAVMGSLILVVPDVLSFLEFGKFFPTYFLTFAYSSSEAPADLLFPAITCFVLLILANLYAVLGGIKLTIDDRR